jgi:glycosyltransferase involved in cell wall biosynthesis
MKKKILISMYSLNIGGAERSLIGLLESFDYSQYEIDLFLYRHEGEFLSFVPDNVNLLPSIKPYTTLERPIKEIIQEGHIFLGCMRILAKVKTIIKTSVHKKENGTYKQMQYTWHYSIPRLPKLRRKYDVAISFLGPHHFILDKVEANVKLGWNHTDYFTIVHPDIELDEKMWAKLDYIVNVSKDCEVSFLKVFPKLKHKTIVVENIISPSFVKEQSIQNVKSEMPDDGSFKICSVGRFSDAKGFDMAILACKQLVQTGYDVKWYIVGYGGDEEYLKQLIKQHHIEERVILLGKKVNPYPYIKECDLYCQPSRYEGKAVTVREAQILEKPVLITNFPTANSQLENGVDGYICELSVEGITEGIIKLFKDIELRKRLSENCEKRDYSNYHELESVYMKIDQKLLI